MSADDTTDDRSDTDLLVLICQCPPSVVLKFGPERIAHVIRELARELLLTKGALAEAEAELERKNR